MCLHDAEVVQLVVKKEEKKNQTIEKGQKWVCSLWWWQVFLRSCSSCRNSEAGREDPRSPESRETDCERNSSAASFQGRFLTRLRQGPERWQEFSYIENRTYKRGYFPFNLVKSIEGLFFRNQGNKEIYSTSWPFLWWLLLVPSATGFCWVFWKQDPNWGDSSIRAWKAEETWFFTPAPPLWPEGLSPTVYTG